MNIYIFNYNGGELGSGYGGGMAVVAANTPEEAFELLKDEYRYDELEPSSIDWYCNEKSCIECTELSANIDIPKVIDSNFYSE